jgi:SAM-dependent methyltransferase
MIADKRGESALTSAPRRLRWAVDRCERDLIAGWVDDDGPVEWVWIELNRRAIAAVAPTIFRQDLKDAGIGDGRRAFFFDPSRYIETLPSTVTVRCGDQALISKEVGIPENENVEQSLSISQQRWRRDEPAIDLTWGALMTGDSLWDHYYRYREFAARDRILEIGPGYGRLLKTAIERKIPFAEYIGLDLSEARVLRLREAFPLDRVRFAIGDINTWRDDRPFDVALCSATFEHLYPDCRKALTNLTRQLRPEGKVMIDFIRTRRPLAGFEQDGTYVRSYPIDELRGIFADCGFSIVTIDTVVLGRSVAGKPVERFLVCACPR